MIITELKGRIGNGLFQIAIGLYLSKQLNVEFGVRPHKNSRIDYYYQEIFPYEFFRNFKILDLNYNVSNFKTIHNNKKYSSYKDFPIKDNIITKEQYKYAYNNKTKYVKDTRWVTENVEKDGYILTGKTDTTTKTTYIDLGTLVNSKKELNEYTYDVKTRILYKYKYRKIDTKV